MACAFRGSRKIKGPRQGPFLLDDVLVIYGVTKVKS